MARALSAFSGGGREAYAQLESDQLRPLGPLVADLEHDSQGEALRFHPTAGKHCLTWRVLAAVLAGVLGAAVLVGSFFWDTAGAVSGSSGASAAEELYGNSAAAMPEGAPVAEEALSRTATHHSKNASHRESHRWHVKPRATCDEVKSLTYSMALEHCIDVALEDPECARPPSVSFQSTGGGSCFCATASPCSISRSSWLDLYVGLKQHILQVEDANGTLANASDDRQAECLVEEDTDYPGNDLTHVDNVNSTGHCCSICRRHDECLAWTWTHNTCYLKGNMPRQMLTKVRVRGLTSGQTRQVDKPSGLLEVRWAEPGTSLFCFSLFRPWSRELALLKMQFESQASIFLCDEYRTYSNAWTEVATGVWSTAINSTLEASIGGYFRTALNVDIFRELWHTIFEEGRYQLHDWTVKVDPDAVFFPSRLRKLLAKHEEKPNGVFLNNCKYGFHGPVEVFSRNALRAFDEGEARCHEELKQATSWGEDYYVDVCLSRVLKVTRQDELTMMIEDHCDPPVGWRSCSDQTAAVFHPFKASDEYRACITASGMSAFVYRRLSGSDVQV